MGAAAAAPNLAGDGRARDLDQAKALVVVLLRDDRFALEDALAHACGRGRAGWAEPIGRSMQEIGYEALLQG